MESSNVDQIGFCIHIHKYTNIPATKVQTVPQCLGSNDETKPGYYHASLKRNLLRLSHKIAKKIWRKDVLYERIALFLNWV